MKRFLIGAAGIVALAAPAMAQDAPLEGRVGRLEGEMRAVQRKVFPNGATAMVEPQNGPAVAPSIAGGVPASEPIADLNARVSSLESQMTTMTGQIEQAQHRLRQLEDSFADYRKATDAKLAGGAAASPVLAVPTAPRPRTDDVPSDAPAPTAVAGVERPDSGDAAEDGYLYGYRLWAAKKYPEAEAQLMKVVKDHPKHRRASFAQNLLGRAYLDEGKPNSAAIAFFDNYKKYPDGERAPDSLFYMGSALMKANKPTDACEAYRVLTEAYGDKISAGMKADVAKARVTARCK